MDKTPIKALVDKVAQASSRLRKFVGLGSSDEILSQRTTKMPYLSVDYKVYGRVQGVFFRKCAREKAKELGLRGWVRNDDDGTVVGTIQGPVDQIEKMKHWLSHVGSPHAVIEKCDFTNEKTIDDFEYPDFGVRH